MNLAIIFYKMWLLHNNTTYTQKMNMWKRRENSITFQNY